MCKHENGDLPSSVGTSSTPDLQQLQPITAQLSMRIYIIQKARTAFFLPVVGHEGMQTKMETTIFLGAYAGATRGRIPSLLANSQYVL